MAYNGIISKYAWSIAGAPSCSVIRDTCCACLLSVIGRAGYFFLRGGGMESLLCVVQRVVYNVQHFMFLFTHPTLCMLRSMKYLRRCVVHLWRHHVAQMEQYLRLSPKNKRKTDLIGDSRVASKLAHRCSLQAILARTPGLNEGSFTPVVLFCFWRDQPYLRKRRQKDVMSHDLFWTVQQ